MGKETKEIELKILEINVDEIHKKLTSMGALQTNHCLVHERAYDYPDKRLKKNDQLCRIRKCGEITQVTFKTNRKQDPHFFEQDELEIIASDFEATCQMIRLLGLHLIKDRQKLRTTYELGNLRFEMDKYPTIPPYLEIEGPKSQIIDILPRIGYTLNQTTNMTSTKVLKYYGQNPNFQFFEKK